MKKITTFLFLFGIALAAVSQQKANYELAAKFSPERQRKMLFSTNVDPHWLKSNHKFWYVYETPSGKHWYVVDAATATKKEMFDPDRLAAEITKVVQDPFDGLHLKIDSLQFLEDENTITFQVPSTKDIVNVDTAAGKKKSRPEKKKKTFYFKYNISGNQLTELVDFKRPKRNYDWANIAPDSSVVLFAKAYNLYWMSWSDYKKALVDEKDSTITEHALTTTGEQYYGYGSYGYGEDNLSMEKKKKDRRGVYGYWSPDSRYFALTITDERKVKELWVINSLSQPRPTLETYKYAMPGDTAVGTEELQVWDLSTKTKKLIPLSLYKDQGIGIERLQPKENTRDDAWRPNVWLGTKNKFYITRSSRDLTRIDYLTVDAATGTVDSLFGERMNTYINLKPLKLLTKTNEIIEWSERDGWGHFYLYAANGKLKNQITSGPFHCESIEGIDEVNRVLYFTAGGVDKKINPYYLQLYSIRLDGTGLKALGSNNYFHTVSMNDDQKYFVDAYSRVDAAPKNALFAADGRRILTLDSCDMSAMFAAGYHYPEVIKLKADDGITDLWGVVYRPFDFDSTRKYPLAEYVYPGPQTEAVQYAFTKVADRTDRLAQIGMIVLTIGNRGGNPARSKWYHNYGYGNLRDYGLADKKTAAEQLADKYKYIDLNRVGIHGHSGGGFMSTAAMLVYPDFFKVAVSSSGNHDNRIYNRWWSETHHGVKETVSDKGDTSFVYSITTNPEIAKNLKGHLLLTSGDMDNNVHPANTIRVMDALIKAHKRFDYLELPGQRHGYGPMQEYFFWRLCDYYSQWLIGDRTPRPVDMLEADRDIPDTK